MKIISSRRVVKIMKNFNKGIFSWSQIPRTTFLRIVWPTIRKTTNETLGVKEFLTNKLKIQRECWVYSWWHSTARGFPFFAHWWFVKSLSRKEMCWEGFFFFISTDIAFGGSNNVIPTTDLFRLEVIKTDVCFCVSFFVQESITSWFKHGCWQKYLIFFEVKCGKNGIFPSVVKEMLFFLLEAYRWRQLIINPPYF